MTLFEIFPVIINLITFISWIILLVVILEPKYKKHRRKTLITIAIFNAVAFAFLLSTNAITTTPPNTEINIQKGEFWDIDTIFKQEPDLSLRIWKRNLLKELKANITTYRKRKGLRPIPIQTIESFSPQKLSQALTTYPKNFVLLDVREPLEISKFHLKNSQYHRYGDLVNDIFPSIPVDKTIIVICYSGIRGFIAANILKEKGFENIAFIRGGLGEWVKNELPIEGEDTFDFLQDKYEKIPLETAISLPNPKIEFHTNLKKNTPGFFTSLGDLSSSTELDKFTKKFINKEIILACKTESDCFDAVAFAYVFELEGGKILGYTQLERK